MSRLLPVLLGLASCASAPADPALRTGSDLALMPRLAVISPLSSGVYVRATLRVYAPTPDQRCAGEAWEWGDGSVSTHDEDCVPEELAPWPVGVPMILSRQHVYRGPGEYQVAVSLFTHAGVLVRVPARVVVTLAGAE